MGHSLISRRMTRRAAALAPLLVLLAGPVSAQLTTDDVKCIETINKFMQKVANAENKALSLCTRDFAKGTLVAPTVLDCANPATNDKVLKAVIKAFDKSDQKCGGVPPPIGPPSLTAAPGLAVAASAAMMNDIFGSPVDDALIVSTDGHKCQREIIKVIQKCEATRLGEFNKCKRTGLKNGTIVDAAGIADTCLGTGQLQPDPKAKINKQCIAKPVSKINSKCVNKGVALDLAFPGCGTANANDLTVCIDGRIRCRTCELLNGADGLSRDCDLMDDGDDGNSSCSEPTTCGDGLVDGAETCDDGGTTGGDGCSATCQAEPGYECSGSPSTCSTVCGDGVVIGTETCDDGNTNAGDGCDATCQTENGYDCTGTPSTCTEICGDSQIVGTETCDDGGTSAGDGCDATCQVETGYNCVGEPSVCNEVCGDGEVVGGETCDDGGTSPGDGCSITCQVEGGFQCVGAPSVCTGICGDGLVRGAETCDDADTDSGDGCNSTCQVETGYQCVGQPSTCTAICGDSLVRGAETCDDGATVSGDGCSSTCQTESGYLCAGEPSTCAPECGDGLVLVGEGCDDGGTVGGDGCSATCTVEVGYTCSSAPSVCSGICGDGLIRGVEGCDDGNTAPGDGCNGTCVIESGFTCAGEPSTCGAVCGDGAILGAETCDDGNPTPGDGCDDVCDVEFGYICTGTPSTCVQFGVVITSPTSGSFSTAASTTVDGLITSLPPALASLTINGVPTAVSPAGTFSTTVPLDDVEIFNPIRATVTDIGTGATAHDRVVVIAGDSVADGALSPESVALRLNDSGLDTVEPLVESLAGDGLDLATLIPVGLVLIDDECFIDVLGACLGRATVVVANPPPTISGFGLTMDSMTNFVAGDITVTDIRVDVDLQGSGLVPSCDIQMQANAAFFNGDFALEPGPTLDVNQIGPLDVSFTGFNTIFGGICDAPIIGDIIQAFLPDVEALTIDAMADFLGDPDGAGPQDSPIAAGIQDALAGVEITGPIGSGLGVMLDAPLFAALEDNAGITLGSDSSFTTEVGTGPGECVPPIGAPDLAASYTVAEAFPAFSATTPVGGLPYGMGLCFSTSAFNQLLKAQTECGLLVTSLTEIDLGTGPLPITAAVLSLLLPEFASFPPSTPFRIDLQPTLGPIVGPGVGPAGELGELKVAQILVSIVQDDGSEDVVLIGAFDANIGFNMGFAAGGLNFILTPPDPTEITVAILSNPLGVDEVALENDVLPPLLGLLLPDLAGSLASFPIPDFLGLELSGIEVSRNGAFFSLFADLSEAP